MSGWREDLWFQQEFPSGKVTLKDSGHELLCRCEAPRCSAAMPGQRVVCGYVAGHDGDHWPFSEELAEQAAPVCLAW